MPSARRRDILLATDPDAAGCPVPFLRRL